MLRLCPQGPNGREQHLWGQRTQTSSSLASGAPMMCVQINDVSLQDYTAVKKYAEHLPHSAGQYAAKRFRKAQGPIVECLTHSMMTHGRNNCKKLVTLCIAKHAFETIHLLTEEDSL
ncbi:40S ribosomal protein S5-like [Macaca thibetana thibetana]|uniref:40S ribosomal protein S5-like n=1 Tax=Macaca thibetana thibetana TaxID=257877 RepID=UPI0021BC456E|nr:40S ribosomal protein S5-like [Macaca thibetana thibetana]